MTLVLYYIFLVFFSILIWRNAYSAWKLDGSFTIPIVTFFMFYFTLGGAFIFPIDAFFNFKGTEIGLHYLPIFDRLFLVSFDYDYILSIFYYIIFILVFQYTYLFSIKKIATKFESVKTTQTINNEQEASSFKFVVNPWIVLAISFLLIGVSATILWDEIYYAIANEKSIYSTTRATLSKYYTLHQLANEFSVLIPFLAFSFAITKSNKFNVQAITKKSTLFIILFACVVSASYIVLLGNRREVLSGLVVCALIAVNNYKNVYFKRFFVISFLTLSLFLANDFFRSTYIPIQLNSVLKFDKQRKIPKLAPTQIVNQNPVDSLGQKTPLKLKIKKQSNKSYIAARSKQVISSFVFSNELFYAHFSLYGCIHKDVPLT